MIKRPVLFTIILLCFAHADGFAQQVLDAERQALIDLYEATGGDDWYRNEGWLEPDSDHCDWEGVGCGGGPRVRALLLENNNLTGTIPLSIRQLHGVRRLWLSDNRLEGKLRSVLINELTNLEVLDLSTNRLSGPLPEYRQTDTVTSRLWDLDLSGNHFDGELPLTWSQMPQLFRLDLSANRLTGTLPDEWGQLELESLFLQHNRLSGPIDNAVHAMASRAGKILRLDDNQFSGPIPAEIMDLDFNDGAGLFIYTGAGGLPGLDLCWNEFEPPDGELLAFVNSNQEGADLLACIGKNRRELDATVGGSWYDPMRSGEGFTQQVLHDGRMFIYWFSYSPWQDEVGRQFWAVGAVTPSDIFVRFDPVFSPEDGRFAQGLGDGTAEF